MALFHGGVCGWRMCTVVVSYMLVIGWRLSAIFDGECGLVRNFRRRFVRGLDQGCAISAPGSYRFSALPAVFICFRGFEILVLALGGKGLIDTGNPCVFGLLDIILVSSFCGSGCSERFRLLATLGHYRYACSEICVIFANACF